MARRTEVVLLYNIVKPLTSDLTLAGMVRLDGESAPPTAPKPHAVMELSRCTGRMKQTVSADIQELLAYGFVAKVKAPVGLLLYRRGAIGNYYAITEDGKERLEKLKNLERRLKREDCDPRSPEVRAMLDDINNRSSLSSRAHRSAHKLRTILVDGKEHPVL